MASKHSERPKKSHGTEITRFHPCSVLIHRGFIHFIHARWPRQPQVGFSRCVFKLMEALVGRGEGCVSFMSCAHERIIPVALRQSEMNNFMSSFFIISYVCL